MKNIPVAVLPLIGAVVVFGVSLWDSALVMQTSLIILVLLSLYLFFFNSTFR